MPDEPMTDEELITERDLSDENNVVDVGDEPYVSPNAQAAVDGETVDYLLGE